MVDIWGSSRRRYHFHISMWAYKDLMYKLLGKPSDLWPITLHTLCVGTPCHMAQTLTSMSLFISITVLMMHLFSHIWQRWYIYSILGLLACGSIPECVWNSCCRIVTEEVFPNYRPQNILCYRFIVFILGSPWHKLLKYFPALITNKL